MRKSDAVSVVTQILRMSQKALACTLALIGVGYVGGLAAIFFRPDVSDALTKYASIFTPVWTVEIGLYGVGSTLENLQKVKAQVETLGTTETNENG